MMLHRLATDNDQDLFLLKNRPKELVAKHQGTIRIILKKYIATGLFAPADFDDMLQTVSESLLAKLSTIQQQFNGSSLVKTYLSTIIRNICLVEHRKNARQHNLQTIDDQVPAPPVDFSDTDLIEYEVKKFKAILTQHYRLKGKLVLCIKLVFRIPITQETIDDWYPNCEEDDRRLLLDTFGSDYIRKPDYDVFRIITPIMNKQERRSNSEDAVRRWTQSKIEEIIEILNGHPPHSTYTKESLRLLAERAFLQMHSSK